ncbi:hypothetical protein [Zoogloea sp.]|uniref:hypothetical protein n=1 Tax=Zoogloea sp. TaxID=49181 RepID=UPI001416C049|nr:MAG: hypothetical protein F9K15_23490 [Zoogloea sp.]
MNQPPKLHFSPGEIVATRGADTLLREQNLHPIRLLARHLSGDWGEVGAEDARANEAALQTGARLLSVYMVAGVKLFVITEAEPRAVTTILLADEY